MKKITYIEFNKLKPSIENPRLSPTLLERNHYDPFKAYLEYFKSESTTNSIEEISKSILLIGNIVNPLVVYKKNDVYIIYDGNRRYFGLYYLLNDNIPDFYSKDIKSYKYDKSQLPKELPCHIFEDIKQVYHITHMLNTIGE